MGAEMPTPDPREMFKPLGGPELAQPMGPENTAASGAKQLFEKVGSLKPAPSESAAAFQARIMSEMNRVIDEINAQYPSEPTEAAQQLKDLN